MEDILASIRRILSEDGAVGEGAREPTAAPATDAGEDRDQEPEVLALDPSMLVPEPVAPGPPPERPITERPPPERPITERPIFERPSAPEAVLPEPIQEPPPEPPAPAAEMRGERLVAPEAAAAATSSVGSLLRTLGSHRQSLAVSRSGPTLEDMVREELRPVLKAWLDEHLPSLVERLVRAEIERVVGRAADL